MSGPLRAVFDPQKVVNDISDLQATVGITSDSGLQKAISDVSGRVQLNEHAIGVIDASLAAHYSLVTTNISDISDVSGRVQLNEHAIGVIDASLAAHYSLVTTNISDISDISGLVQQNASDINDIQQLLENTLSNGKFYCNLGVKLPTSNSTKSYTVTLEIEVELTSYILYQTYTDESNNEIKESSNILPVFDNLRLKNTYNNFHMPLSQLFNSGIYFSEELKNELQYLCRYNEDCLEFTRQSVTNFTPQLTGKTYELKVNENNVNDYLIDDSKSSTDHILTENHYYTPLFNPPFINSINGGFTMGIGKTAWNSVDICNNQLTYSFNPYWCEENNQAFGQKVGYSPGDAKDTFGVGEFTIPYRNLSLTYTANIEFLDDSFYNATKGRALIRVPSFRNGNTIYYTNYSEFMPKLELSYLEEYIATRADVLAILNNALTRKEIKGARDNDVEIKYFTSNDFERLSKIIPNIGDVKIVLNKGTRQEQTWVILNEDTAQFKVVLIPEQLTMDKNGIINPIKYDTKSYETPSKQMVTYESEEWGNYSFNKIRGKMLLTYSQSSTLNQSISTNNLVNNTDYTGFSSWSPTPNIEIWVTQRTGWYVQQYLQEQTWNLGESLISNYMNGTQGFHTLNRYGSPFVGWGELGRKPVIGNNSNVSTCLPLLGGGLKTNIGKSFLTVDPRPHENSDSTNFSYIDLYRDWSKPVAPGKYNIFVGGYNQGGLQSTKYEDTIGINIISPSALDLSKDIIKNFLKNYIYDIGSSGRTYMGQIFDGGVGSGSDFGNDVATLVAKYLREDTTIPQIIFGLPPINSFRGFQQTRGTAALSRNFIYDNTYIDGSNQLQDVSINPVSVPGIAYDADLQNIMTRFDEFAVNKAVQTDDRKVIFNMDRYRTQIRYIYYWLESTKINGLRSQYPGLDDFESDLTNYLQENGLGELSWTNRNTIDSTVMNARGPYFNPIQPNIPMIHGSTMLLSYNISGGEQLTSDERENVLKLNLYGDFSGIDTLLDNDRLSIFNYNDRQNAFDNSYQLFINWGEISDLSNSDEVLDEKIYSEIINSNKGHPLLPYYDYNALTATTNYLSGIMNEKLKLDEFDIITEPSNNNLTYVKPRTSGSLRLYAQKWMTAEEWFKDFNYSLYYRETASCPTVGYAEGTDKGYRYLYGPRARKYNNLGQPLPESFNINGISGEKIIVQHDQDTVIFKSYPQTFDISSGKTNYHNNPKPAALYRSGLYADSPYKWFSFTRECTRSNFSAYYNTFYPEFTGAYGSISIFVDRIYLENDKPTNATESFVLNGVTYYYALDERYWRDSIKAVATNGGKFRMSGNIKDYYKKIYPKILFDNDIEADNPNCPKRYAYPSFTKSSKPNGLKKYTGLFPFDVADHGRNRDSSDGTTGHIGDGNESAIIQGYEAGNLSKYIQYNSVYKKYSISAFLDDAFKETIYYYNPPTGTNPNPSNSQMEQIYSINQYGLGFDKTQVMYGGLNSYLLLMRQLKANGMFTGDIPNDATNKAKLDSMLENGPIKFSGPHEKLTCNLNKPELKDGTKNKKQYNVEFTIDNSGGNYTLDISYNSNMSSNSFKTGAIIDIDNPDPILGFKFESQGLIYGHFIMSNDETNEGNYPYILITEFKTNDSNTGVEWVDEWHPKKYGDIIKETEGGLPNTDFITYKFAFLVNDEAPPIYAFTQEGIDGLSLGYIFQGANASALVEKYAEAQVGDLVEREHVESLRQNNFTSQNFKIYTPPIYAFTQEGIDGLPLGYIFQGANATALVDNYAEAQVGDFVDQEHVESLRQNNFTSQNFNIYTPPIYAFTQEGIDGLPLGYIFQGANATALVDKYAEAQVGDFVDQEDVESLRQNSFTSQNFKIY